MDKKTTQSVTPFDELTVPPELQILKLLLPYTPVSNQKMLGILVKFLELEHTIQFFQHFTLKLQSQTLGSSSASISDILEDIAPYLPENEKETLNTFHDVLNMLEMMQMFQTSSESDTNSHTGSDNSAGIFNPMDLMMGMFSPEQQEMFQTYQNMFDQKGVTTHERMDEQSTTEEHRSAEVRTDSDGSIEDCREVRPGVDADHDGTDYRSKQKRDSIHTG